MKKKSACTKKISCSHPTVPFSWENIIFFSANIHPLFPAVTLRLTVPCCCSLGHVLTYISLHWLTYTCMSTPQYGCQLSATLKHDKLYVSYKSETDGCTDVLPCCSKSGGYCMSSIAMANIFLRSKNNRNLTDLLSDPAAFFPVWLETAEEYFSGYM